jgi:GT2 family glycosyltransferase
MWTGTMKHAGIREKDLGQHDIPQTTAYATGCCVLTRRHAVDKVGMLDESYHMYTEDADWSLRIRQAGYTIAYEPRARVWHKLSVSAGGHLSWYKMKNKYVSNLRFFSRYAAWYQWIAFPWLGIVVNGVSALRYLFTVRR